MPAYRVRALVMRKTKLGETDVIVTMLAEQGLQVRAVAKGMRKPGSRFGGRLEPFSVVDVMLHTGRSLDVVSEVETVIGHGKLREDFDRSTAASVVADVLDKLSCEGQIEDRLFDLGVTTLDVMEDCRVDRLLCMVVAFLVKAMAMHGLRPELLSCAGCAREATGGSRFSLDAGGILCPECGETHGASIEFSEAARNMLVELLGSTMRQVADADMDERAVGECFTLMRSFVSYHVPARLKALDFYAGVTT